jgi:hypothetical protein
MQTVENQEEGVAPIFLKIPGGKGPLFWVLLHFY